MLALARRAAQRRRAGRPRAAVHGRRGDRAGRRAGVRRVAAAQRLRLRLRPRLADRRDRRRLADVLPHRGRLPRRGGARRASARRTGRSAILAAARAIAAMRLGRLDERDDGERRHDRRRHARRTSCPSAAARRARCAALDDARAEALVAEIVDRAARRGQHARLRVRRRRHASQRLFDGYRLTRRARRRCASPRRRCAACGYEPRADRQRRRLGRQRAASPRASPCVNLANGTERNHEPGERVSVAALEGMLDVALALLDAAADARCDGALASGPMLKLRRAIVVDAGSARDATLEPTGLSSELRLEVEPSERRRATSGDRRRRRSSGARELGDELIVNVEALDLGLGSGGFDVVHVNLTRGLDGDGRAGRARDEAQLHEPAARRRCRSRDERARRCRSSGPSRVLALHGQLAAARVGVRRRPRRARGSATCRPPAARCRAGTRAPCASCASAACWPAT